MTHPKIDHVLAGIVVAFDAETGDVLHVHEKIVETVDGQPGCATEISSEECEEISRRDRPRLAPAGGSTFSPRRRKWSNGRTRSPSDYHVDPMTRELRVERRCGSPLEGC